MKLEFKIPGEPMGKQRPKFSRQGQFVKTYTPQKTVNYETYVKERFLIEYPEYKPLEGELVVRINSYFPIPKSFSKKKKEQAEMGMIKPTKKPDCDNIAKIVLDSLNGIAFMDDKQVVNLVVTKNYDPIPRVEVDIKEIGGSDETHI